MSNFKSNSYYRGLFRFLSLRVPLSDKPTYDLCAEYLCIESLENPSKFYGFRSIIAQKFAGSAEPVEPVLKRPLLFTFYHLLSLKVVNFRLIDSNLHLFDINRLQSLQYCFNLIIFCSKCRSY